MAAIAKAKAATDPHRRALIAKVHIAPKQLGMTEEDYRAVMRRITGQLSAATCDVEQLEALLAEFTRMGFRAIQTGPKKGGGAQRADHPVARKARAMWISLGLLCAIEDHSESALEAFARRQLGCAKLQWMNQAQADRLIEGLKAIGERHGWCQSVAGLAKVHHLHALKHALCEAILDKLKRAGEATSNWDLGEAAWRLCRLSDPDQYVFRTAELEAIATALGKLLRLKGGPAAFAEIGR